MNDESKNSNNENENKLEQLKQRENELKQEEKKDALTSEQKKERKQLLSEGFPNWTRKDYLSFIKACELYG